MDDRNNLISQMHVVTVSREYGSGGGEIARRIAQRLGWRLVDHEIVLRVARELGVSEEDAAARDERTEGFVASLLSSMQAVDPSLMVLTPVPSVADPQAYPKALSRVVQAAASSGYTVIVGRGSQVLLAQRRDALHIRIVAPLEQRIRYVMQREGLDYNAARSRIQLKDHDRQKYLQAVHHQRPDNPGLYDLVINTGVLDLDSAVDLIALALQRKATRLELPAEQLGPGAGLPPYPGHPHDLRPPDNFAGA
ncbi:cytidylate kinase-like family protein [Ktedonosporobacter rubrisoli]|uniref:Cytidylate kinase-like family protein n=1 Tax=Ktedonosporobacter rubrisoli TaxID=2509675 RepID=A0A4P6JU83_KTERU|nr:cytidylate kinase-like family protein [Ktedonosporobacter rubrisoli]QBD78870.1 cytidylate kinase-like family protein [Ktedonosporobacter rubrisoli]